MKKCVYVLSPFDLNYEIKTISTANKFYNDKVTK